MRQLGIPSSSQSYMVLFSPLPVMAWLTLKIIHWLWLIHQLVSYYSGHLIYVCKITESAFPGHVENKT